MRCIPLRCLTSLAILLAASALPMAAGDGPGPLQPTKRDACPVCGMMAQVIFDDGSALFFDGAKDLFHYLLARDRFAPSQRDLGIAAAFVTSYYDLEPLPAREAWYVVGGDVLGPMGRELVPHPSREAAEEFLRDHRGRQIVRFEEVTAELLETLGAGGGRR